MISSEEINVHLMGKCPHANKFELSCHRKGGACLEKVENLTKFTKSKSHTEMHLKVDLPVVLMCVALSIFDTAEEAINYVKALWLYRISVK